MAVPNIAALTELYGGTLAWELTAEQPVFSFDGKKFQTAGGTYNWTSGWTSASPSYIDISYTVPSSFSNRLLIFVAGSVNYFASDESEVIATTNMPTYGGTTFSELTTNSDWDLPYSGRNRIFYMVNPPTGTNNIRFTAAPGTAIGSGSRLLNYEINTFYNVNQDTPFKIQLSDAIDTASLLVGKNLNYGNYNATTMSDPGMRQSYDFTANPGDLCIHWMQREAWVNTSYSDPNASNYSYKSLTDGVTWNYFNRHTAYSQMWESHYFSVPSTVGGGEVNMHFLPSSLSSSGYTNTYHSARGVVIQQANASTLFTVPTGYVVKVNQIYAGSASAGLAMSAQIKGLAANGATPATLRNTADNADLITTTTNDAVGNIASGITITPGTQTKLLTQPIWLQEGNELAVGVGFGQANMLSATSMKAAPTATCTVSMEIIKT